MRLPHAHAGLRALRLELVQEIDGALSTCCCLEDGPVVVLQNRQPGRDVGSVVFTSLGSEFKLSEEEGGACADSA